MKESSLGLILCSKIARMAPNVRLEKSCVTTVDNYSFDNYRSDSDLIAPSYFWQRNGLLSLSLSRSNSDKLIQSASFDGGTRCFSIIATKTT